MTVLTKYVSYNNYYNALIDCHFATKALHLFAKCVTHLTTDINSEFSIIFCLIKYGFKLK